MRKTERIILAGLLAVLSSSCVPPRSSRIRLEIQSAPLVDLSSYESIMIADFLLEGENSDFDLAGELKSYLLQELQVKFKGRVLKAPMAPPSLEPPVLEEFKTSVARDARPEGTFVLLAGAAGFTQEELKAVANRKSDLERIFSEGKSWEERRSFSLALSLKLVSGETGRILYEKDFKERFNTRNTGLPGLFAFYGLVRGMKQRFLLDLFGEEIPAERYLLVR